MLLIELATQSVQGFSANARAVFKLGYNVLVPPRGAAPGVGRLLSALLYDDGHQAAAELVVPPGPGRAGLTVQGMDGRTYRLVRTLGGGGALHRLEPNRTWTLLSQDPQQINAMVGGAFGLPSRALFEELFCLSAQLLPSRRAGAPAPTALPQPAPAAQAPAGPERKLRPNALVEAALAATARKFDSARAREQIEVLRGEVERGRALEEQQYRFEGMQQRIFQLEERLKQVDKLVEDVEKAKEGLKAGHSVESLGLPPDARERLARFDEASDKLHDSIRKLHQETQDAADKAAGAKPEGVWLDRGFQIAVGAGAALLALSAFFRGSPVGYLGLLDIPAFGYAGLVALRWIGDLQYYDSLGRKALVNKDREQKLQAAFDAEYFQIKAAMRVVGVETGREFLEFLDRRTKTEASLAESQARLDAARADPELLNALDEQDRLSAEAKELEKQISEAGAGQTRDWRDAERELLDLEEELARNESGAPLGAGGGPVAAASVQAKEDPIPRLLQAAQGMFSGASLEALGAAVRDRAAQYLLALSDKRFAGIEIDGKGGCVVLSAAGRVPATRLPDPDLDLLYLAIKLTLLEKLAPTGRMVIVLDEPFIDFDVPKQQLVSRMLKHIAGMTQVVHATGLPGHLGLADHAIQG